MRVLPLGLCLGLLTIGIAACGGADGEVSQGSPASSASAATDSKASPEQATAAGSVVQRYLGAVKLKDATSGRTAICADQRSEYDAALTTSASSFGPRFTLSTFTITDARVREGVLRIYTEQSVSVLSRAEPLDGKIVYTMANESDGWCIVREGPDLGDE